MPHSQPWTIGRLLQWTSDFLQQKGSPTPRLDAEVLLAETLGRPRIELYTCYDLDPGDEVRAEFRDLVRRRAAGEPVAYLVGHREFYSLAFQVTPAVLIPRPETEFVVIALLDAVKQYAAGRALSIADVGTGSGVIAVCAAKHVPESHITAIDISGAALEVTRRNAEAHGVADRLALLRSDLLGMIPPTERFDFVVSNPPYVATGDLEQTSVDVKDYEPRAALVAGPNGDEVINRLVPQAAERLVDGGWLIIEISPMLESRVHSLLDRDGRFASPTTVKDLAGLPRVVSAQRQDG